MLIFAPWRMAYIRSSGEASRTAGSDPPCIFCDRRERRSDATVLARTDRVYTILNTYPYAPGHVMICPYRHASAWSDLDGDERTELLLETQRACAALRRVYAPERIHLGANVGRAAGAGVVGHFHLHLVPLGATGALEDPWRENVAEMPEPLEETARKLTRALAP